MKKFAFSMVVGLCGIGLAACSADAISDEDNADLASTDQAVRQTDGWCDMIARSSQDPRMLRGMNWVDHQVMYNNRGPSEGSGGYRADCSGFVSMAWGLPAPGSTTDNFWGGPSQMWNWASVGITWEELQPGDALNYAAPGKAGHIMMFAGWRNEEHTEFCTMESFSHGSPTRILYHSVFDSAAEWGGRGRGGSIGEMYLPIRGGQ